MTQRNRLAILALVAAIALVGAGTGANAGPAAEIDRGSGITVVEHADALIAINGNEITNQFPMTVDVTVSDDEGDELYSGTVGPGDSTGTIEVTETTEVIVTVTGDATTAKIEGAELEGTGPEITVEWSNINAPITLTGDVDFESVTVANTWSVEPNGNSQNANVQYASDDEIADIGCAGPSDTVDVTITGEMNGGEQFTVVAEDVNCAGNLGDTGPPDHAGGPP